MDEEMAATFASQPPGAALLRALTTFLERDSYLLEVDANERSITFLIGRYLAVELPNFDIDCEYNRDGVDPKKIGHLNLHADEEDTEARTVFPDIIAHRRNSKDNYLVVEVKKTTNHVPREVDFTKLAGYKRDLSYRHAVFIELTAGGEAGVSRVEWV
jgi:hypothetical protein